MSDILTACALLSNPHSLYSIAHTHAELERSQPRTLRPSSTSQRLTIWREDRLSHLAKHVAILILDRQALRDQACTMGLDAMAVTLCTTRRSVDRALQELRDIGWLTVERRGRGNPAARWIDVG